MVGPNVVLPPFTKLSSQPVPKDAPPFQPVNVGADGTAHVWLDAWEEETDDDALNRMILQMGFNTTDVPTPTLDSSSSDNYSDDGEETEDEHDKHAREIEDTVHRAISESHTVDNCALELNALKLACNITFRDLRLSSIPAIIKHVESVEHVKKVFTKWGMLIARFVHGEMDQIDALWILLVRLM
jgi:translation initiation factor eIF-2B subunit epsilon